MGDCVDEQLRAKFSYEPKDAMKIVYCLFIMIIDDQAMESTINHDLRKTEYIRQIKTSPYVVHSMY